MSVELAPIIRALNGVKSIGQAQAAAGAALRYASVSYAVLSDCPKALQSGYRRQLDGARTEVERHYKKIGSVGKNPVDAAAWKGLRRGVERIYIEGSAIETAADYKGSIDVGSILITSIKEAPSVFLKTVGEATGAVAAAAGGAAGAGLSALLASLGVWAGVLAVVAAAFVAFKFGLLKGFV